MITIRKTNNPDLISSSMNVRSQKGFTLVELVVVIVVLGVLAAIAMPKFASISKSARVASLESLKGAVISAANLARQLCVASTECDIYAVQSGGTITVDGVTGQLSWGFPSEGDALSYVRIDKVVNISGFTFIPSSPANFTLDAATDPSTCKLTYSKAGGILSVTLTTTGC